MLRLVLTGMVSLDQWGKFIVCIMLSDGHYKSCWHVWLKHTWVSLFGPGFWCSQSPCSLPATLNKLWFSLKYFHTNIHQQKNSYPPSGAVPVDTSTVQIVILIKLFSIMWFCYCLLWTNFLLKLKFWDHEIKKCLGILYAKGDDYQWFREIPNQEPQYQG